ncbi:hypothetical protein Tco_1128065 [Tanacetum coccineum]
MTFDETPPPSKTSPLVDDDLDEEEVIKVTEKKNLENDIEDETLEIDEIVNINESRNHPLENSSKSSSKPSNLSALQGDDLNPLIFVFVHQPIRVYGIAMVDLAVYEVVLRWDGDVLFVGA